MSTETSPQQAHLQSVYAPQPHSTPGSGPYSDDPSGVGMGGMVGVAGIDGNTVPSSKGKNGATGPAEGKPKPHVCGICNRGFTTGGHLQRHQRIHTGIKAFKCPYPGCETRTSRQDNLQQHYRTHLSPTLRRGSGTAARQAVAAAMMAAGLKSTSSRQPRKSKGSGVGTPSSSSGASGVHTQSPYQTPTSQGSAPYGNYMYDPHQQSYPAYPPLPQPGVNMAQPQSAQSSRVPSPVNGGSGAMPTPHHQQYFSQQPFSPAYAYPNSNYAQQPYRYGAPGGAMQSPYGAPHPHHPIYSPGLAPEHSQQHIYSPLQTGFPQHSRESSYGIITPGYPGQAPVGGNGYPPRTQTSTPLSQTHDELDPRYRGAPRPPSPRRRLTPPHQADMLAAGVVDPSSMSTQRGAPLGTVPPPYSYTAGTTHMGYTYGAPQGGMAPHAASPRDAAAAHAHAAAQAHAHASHQPSGLAHRTSISSLSEDDNGEDKNGMRGGWGGNA